MGCGPDGYNGRLIPRLTVISRADEQYAVEVGMDIAAGFVEDNDHFAVLELGSADLTGVARGVVIEGDLLRIFHYLTHFCVLYLSPCRLNGRALEGALRFRSQPLMPTWVTPSIK